MRSELEYSGSGVHIDVPMNTFGDKNIILWRKKLTAYQINNHNYLKRYIPFWFILFNQFVFVNTGRNRWRDIRCSKQRGANVKHQEMNTSQFLEGWNN